MKSTWQLRKYLAKEVLGKDIGRKPPQKERRGPERNSAYRAWVRTFPCVACQQNENVEAAHTGSDGGMSMKANDYSCIPLCADCHTQAPDAYHRIGRAAFEARRGLVCAEIAAELRAAWRLHTDAKRA